jgi:hypothetical protein
MNILRSDNADRVAGILFASSAAVAFSSIVARSGLPEQTVASILRSLAHEGVIERVDTDGPAWRPDQTHFLYPVNRALLAKISAGSNLGALIKPVVERFPLVTRALLLDERPEATIVCVLSDPTTLVWYEVLAAIQSVIDAAGRAVHAEGISEQAYRATNPTPAVLRVRSPKAAVLKGDH